MRPRELTIRGFRSYRDEVTFDLRDRHLVGIVGPIGAGKSSILDAIAFALFGKTPRVQTRDAEPDQSARGRRARPARVRGRRRRPGG